MVNGTRGAGGMMGLPHEAYGGSGHGAAMMFHPFMVQHPLMMQHPQQHASPWGTAGMMQQPVRGLGRALAGGRLMAAACCSTHHVCLLGLLRWLALTAPVPPCTAAPSQQSSAWYGGMGMARAGMHGAQMAGMAGHGYAAYPSHGYAYPMRTPGALSACMDGGACGLGAGRRQRSAASACNGGR